MNEEYKLITKLEALESMIKNGEKMIVQIKNQITASEVMDRIGKRLILKGDKYASKGGENQTKLVNLRMNLRHLEEMQDYLLDLRPDIVAESKAKA